MERFTVKGVEFVATIDPDYDHGAPWEECDGHGTVTPWQSSHTGKPVNKRPGQIVLIQDRGSYRLYDFAEACKIARRDGWGFAPGKLVTDRFAHSGKRKFRAYFAGFKFVGYGKDINSAVSALYKAHQESMTPRQYAAAAAMSDFNYLRRYCEGDWGYVVVTVRRADSCECCGHSESVGGVESEYWEEIAREIAEGMLS